MTNPNKLLAAALLITGLSIAGRSPAAVIGYTDFTDFVAATAGMTTSIEDFEAYTAGDTIADGGTLGAITYDYDFGGDTLKVSDAFDTTSPVNFLATDSSDLIFDGETGFALSFAASSAVGMFFISIDNLLDGDIALSSGTDSVSLDVADLVSTLPGGEAVFFLGLVDTMGNGLTSADISTATSGIFTYNIDDIRLATASMGTAPVPGTLALVVLGLIGYRFRFTSPGHEAPRCRPVPRIPVDKPSGTMGD